METLTTAHLAQGSGINQLAQSVSAILAAMEGRAAGTPRMCDTRPLSDKLEEQYREIQFADGVFSVVPLPQPEPEPEPEIEPQPEPEIT